MAAHRYWRINSLVSAGGAFGFCEIQFRITPGVSLGFSGGTPTAASANGGQPGTYDSTKAADGNTATLYTSNGTQDPQWWAYDFGATSGNWRDVAEIAITSRNDAFFNESPTSLAPQWSDNGTSWSTMQTATVAAWTSSAQTKTFAVTPYPLLPNTTWSPGDKSSGITLSGGNLIARNADNAVDGVRAIDGQASGKWYWEYTCNTFTGVQNAVGMASLVLIVGSVGQSSSQTGNCIVSRGAGQVIIDGIQTSLPAIGAINSGALVCVAVDLTAKLVWFRLGAAGNWNNSGTANPATGAGGLSIPNLGGSVAAFPAASINNTNDQVTANFGASAFTGTVPSGFASGFSGSAAAAGSTSQARALIMA